MVGRAALVSLRFDDHYFFFEILLTTLAYVQRKKTTTSSFPSRAVTCATVYSYLLTIAVDYFSDKEYHLQWWHFLLCFLLVLLISFARVRTLFIPLACEPLSLITSQITGKFGCSLSHGLYCWIYTGRPLLY